MRQVNWIDNIDRDKIPYIKEDDWDYSYPTLISLNITQKEKETLFDISNTLFWAMHKTVKSLRHIDVFKQLNFIGSKFDCISNLSRMDFVKDKQGNFKLVEINADTPCAIPETFYGNFRFNSRETTQIEHNINLQLATVFTNLCNIEEKVNLVVFAADPDYMEDWYNAKYLYENFQMHNPITNVIISALLIPLSDLEVFDDGVYVKSMNQKIDVLYRLYPTEMLIEDKSEDGYPIGRKLIELHNEGKVILVNPPEALIMQDKRIPAMMHYLNDEFCFYSRKEAEYIQKHIPCSGLRFETVQQISQAEKIIEKPVYGREGSGITIYDKNKNIIEQSSKTKDVEYIYEEYIEQNDTAVTTAENVKLDGYVTYSVFLLNGEAVGLYGRFDTNKICGAGALWMPINLVENQTNNKMIGFNFK